MNRRKFLQISGLTSAAAVTGFEPIVAETNKITQLTEVKTSPFVHPGIIQTRSQLQTMKSMIEAGQDPVATAWKRLTAQDIASLDFDPKPATHVLRSGYGVNRTGADEFEASGRAAHCHALQWYVTNDPRHAEKVIRILDAWSGTLWDFSGNDAKLLAGWTGGYFCEAAEILRATYPKWKQESRTQFKRMLTRVLVPLLEPFFPEANGNWDAAIMFTMLSMAIYLDDLPLFNKTAHHYLYGPANSGILKYVWPSGQCEESCRDQGHTQLGLGYFSYAALVAGNQGIDLFAAGDNRLALGFEYTSKYMLGMDVPYFGVISPRTRGHFGDFYEATYQHFRFDRKMQMPYTAQAAEKARGDSKAVSAVWLFRGGSEAGTFLPAPKADMHAADAGARDEDIVVQPSWHRVEPGQSIQDAIDHAEDGGTIVLAPGIHTLTSSIELRSNITLVGYGLQTMLHLAADGGEYAMVSKMSKLERITLRNFLIEGALSTDWPMDPNEIHRANSTQMARGRGGISLNGNAEGDIRGITIDHLTVRNCVSNGVSISGAANLIITGCHITDSGGNNAPGHGLNHNLLLNHVSDGTISNCNLAASLGGSGVSVQNSSRVTVSDCNLARNAGYGAQFLNCTEAKMQNTLVEANNLGAYNSQIDGKPFPLSTSVLTERLNGWPK